MQTSDYARNNELLRRASEGDEEARSELIRNNMGLVRSIANRFRDRIDGAETTTAATTRIFCKSVRSV